VVVVVVVTTTKAVQAVQAVQVVVVLQINLLLEVLLLELQTQVVAVAVHLIPLAQAAQA
jgi:hypothetical protein